MFKQMIPQLCSLPVQRLHCFNKLTATVAVAAVAAAAGGAGGAGVRLTRHVQ